MARLLMHRPMHLFGAKGLGIYGATKGAIRTLTKTRDGICTFY